MKQTTLNVIVFLISLWCCSSLVLATGKTNVNEVNDLFDRHIENKSELMRDLQEQQSGTVTQIQSGEGLQHIEGIGEAESTAKELGSIREVDLESSGRQKRASEEYSFYDKNELEPDYSKSGNIAHKQDCDEIVSQTGLSMKKLGSDFQTKLSAVGINCQKDKVDKGALVCEAIPCIDGNCIDKSYKMDSDIVSSISMLKALSQGKNTPAGFKIFEGRGQHCSRKAADYQNCCRMSSGWGNELGARCSKDEQILAEKRAKNLCIYVGKTTKKNMGVVTLTKHYYCCFSNMLEKIIQVQARKQPALRGNFFGSDRFGSGGNPDCRGLTIEELSLVDFSQIDFTELATEIFSKVVMPNVNDVEMRVKNSFDRLSKTQGR